MLRDTRFSINSEIKEAEDHIIKLKFNNIDKVIGTVENLKLVEVVSSHHGNILEDYELIINSIFKRGN